MVTIKKIQDIERLSGNNRLLGFTPVLKESEINYFGNNNILYCEKGVAICGSILNFYADNSLIYLSSNRHENSLSVNIYNDSVLYIGVNNYFNTRIKFIVAEHKNVFLGDDNCISWGCCIMNTDSHLLYDARNKERINTSKSIYIGDHIWIGQDSLILKGTQIDSGAIVGAKSVVSGKNIPHNSVWAGAPLKQIKNNVFWDPACVNSWKEDMSEDGQQFNRFIEKYQWRKGWSPERWIYTYNPSEMICFEEIEKEFGKTKKCEDKVKILNDLSNRKTKNRFVHCL